MRDPQVILAHHRKTRLAATVIYFRLTGLRLPQINRPVVDILLICKTTQFAAGFKQFAVNCPSREAIRAKFAPDQIQESSHVHCR
jgi:hypothetical protein